MVNNLQPKSAADQSWYTAINDIDPSDTFRIQADREEEAKVKLLDMLGYQITCYLGRFLMSDIDLDPKSDPDAATLSSAALQQALDEALNITRWHLSGGATMIGGSLGGGFTGFDDE